MKTERNENKIDALDFFLSLSSCEVTPRNEQELMSMYPLTKSWLDLVAGKLVIFFYADINFQAKYCASISERADRYIALLGTLGNCIRNSQKTVLWWYDDGSLRALIGAVEDEKVRLKLEQSYMWTIQFNLRKAVHDESGDFSRALAWGDIYYGELSDFSMAFKKVGKKAVTYTPAGNLQSLESWLADSMTEDSISKLPVNWEKCIKNRKVMLFSLQPQTLLAVGSNVVTLLENLVYLAQERQEICIWWLVNKNLDNTVSMLAEKLRMDFSSVRQKFKELQNVIYDESGDAARALEHTDVCLGDVCNVKGCHAVRPVVEPPYYSLKEFPECPEIGNYCRDDQKIYFIYNMRNVFGALCEADLTTDKVKVLCQVPNDEEMKDWGLDYVIVIRAGGKLIIPPFFSSRNFLEYDMDTKKLQSIPCEVKVWEPNLERYSAFSLFTEWHDSIYFLGNGNGLVVEYRKSDGKLIYHKDWLVGIDVRKMPIFGGAELIGDVWYLVPTNMDRLLALDMYNMTATMVELTLPEGFHPWKIFHCMEELWLAPLQGNCLVCIHMNTEEMEVIECSSVSKHQKLPFSAIVPWQQARLFLPYFADEVHIWFPDSKEAAPMPEFTRRLVRPFEENDYRNEVMWARQTASDESYLTFRERGTELIEFWSETGDIRYHKLKMETCDEQQFKSLVYSWNLCNLLKPLTDEMEKESWRLYNTAGQRILETVKNM